METALALTVERAPITRLALLGFAKGTDGLYESLEPQFIDRGHERGIRISPTATTATSTCTTTWR